MPSVKADDAARALRIASALWSIVSAEGLPSGEYDEVFGEGEPGVIAADTIECLAGDSTDRDKLGGRSEIASTLRSLSTSGITDEELSRLFGSEDPFRVAALTIVRLTEARLRHQD